MVRPRVDTPIICPMCRSDVAFSTPDAAEVCHCTTCGCTFVHRLVGCLTPLAGSP